MKTIHKIVLFAAGFVVAAGAAYAVGSIAGFLPGTSDSVTLVVEHDFPPAGQASGPHTKLQLHKGAMGSGNTVPVSFELDIAATGVLTSAVLQTGDDANSDGKLDQSEWTTVATGVITQANGATRAVSSPVNLVITADGYRVTYVRTDIGTTWETWTNTPGLELKFN